MTETSSWDPTGEAAAALAAAANQNGVRALSNPQLLHEFFSEHLQDAPTESNLIVTAAELDVVRMVNGHVKENLDLDTAIQLTANTLVALRPIEPDAAVWVTTLFAHTVGYDVGYDIGDESPGEADDGLAAPVYAPEVAAVPGGTAVEEGAEPEYGEEHDAQPEYEEEPEDEEGAAAAAPDGVGSDATTEPAGEQDGWGAGAAVGLAAAGVAAAGLAAGEASPTEPVAAGSPDGPRDAEGHEAVQEPVAPGSPGAAQPEWTGLVAGEKVATSRQTDIRSGRLRSSDPWVAAPPQEAAPAGVERSRTPLYVAAAAVVAIVLYFGIAAAAKLPPFASSSNGSPVVSPPISTGHTGGTTGTTPTKKPTTTTKKTTTTTRTTTTAGATTTTKPKATTTTLKATTTTKPATSSTVVATLSTLAKLMPDQHSSDPASDINVSTCTGVADPGGLRGVTSTLGCSTIPGEAGWELFGYAFDNSADYARSIVAYDKDKLYNVSVAGTACPAPVGEEGLTTWGSTTYPTRNGQVLECFYTSAGGPGLATYIWTLPSENAFFELVGSQTASGADVARWWAQHGEPGTT